MKVKDQKLLSNLQFIEFSKLRFLDNNPRTRTDAGFKKMVEDIKADPSFYQNRPTLVNLVNGQYLVYAGDLRAHAAHDGLGWAEVPCNVEKDVDEKVMRRRAILDNTHREDWDKDALSAWEFEQDELEDMGVDVEWESEEEVSEPGEEDLISNIKDKPPTMKITFSSVESLQKCESSIQEVINRICPDAYYSISAGEV
jgi:ParB-like nuclease domain